MAATGTQPAQTNLSGSVATPFRQLLAAELRNTLHTRHVAMAALLVGMGVVLAAWLPLWPETIYRFFTRIFHLEGWSDIVVFNDFTGLVFFLYWVGVVDVLRVYVQPCEEHYLDLLLSKPITRRDYLVARVAPLLLMLLSIGVVAAVAHAIAIIAVGLPLDVAAYAGAVAILLAFTVCLVALNLLWHDDFVIRWSPLVVLALLLITLVLIALAGYRLARRDVP
jgi:hypothetical protein